MSLGGWIVNSRGEFEYCLPQGHLSDNPAPDSLHELYRDCKEPLKYYEATKKCLVKGVPPNHVDDRAQTALSILVKNINRSLRYHMPRITAVEKVMDRDASDKDVDKGMVKVDQEYQDQVYKCLREMLEKGADPNLLSHTCPGIIYYPEWNEFYEHKLMQKSSRWNLLKRSGTLENTKYDVFDPLNVRRRHNDIELTVLHLVAWRGDARCMKLLLNSGASVNAATTDKRNALHLLYMFCNKPEDLVQCTELLVQRGIDVNLVSNKGQSPLLALLCHFLVKKSHVRHLANASTASNVAPIPAGQDHYRDAVGLCVKVLVNAGACLGHINNQKETPLHHIHKRFQHSLRHCDPEFQEKGHKMVPYHFKVESLIEFSRLLIEVGCQVNAQDSSGSTPLHCLLCALRDLSLKEELNTNDEISECFEVLLKGGASVNLKDNQGRTAMHLLIYNMSRVSHGLKRFLGALKLLFSHGADLRLTDNRGRSVLHVLTESAMKQGDMYALLELLLKHGADPDEMDQRRTHPLYHLMDAHTRHHEAEGTEVQLKHDLRFTALLCKVMSRRSLAFLFSVYQETDIWKVICGNQCPVYSTMNSFYSEMKSLKEICRQVLWSSLHRRFRANFEKLPLPISLVDYVHSLCPLDECSL